MLTSAPSPLQPRPRFAQYESRHSGIITGVFDLEFTNAIPIQFACDPPLFLFGALPEACLGRGYFAWFLREYEPLLEQFLDAMKQEQKRGEESFGQTPLSTLMRDSWTTKRVSFNYGLNNSDQVDSIYWVVFHDLAHPDGVAPELPHEVKADIKKYVGHTKHQLVAYHDNYFKFRLLTLRVIDYGHGETRFNSFLQKFILIFKLHFFTSVDLFYSNFNINNDEWVRGR